LIHKHKLLKSRRLLADSLLLLTIQSWSSLPKTGSYHFSGRGRALGKCQEIQFYEVEKMMCSRESALINHADNNNSKGGFMKRFMSQKAYLVSMVIMTVFISILSGCGGGGGGVWTPPATGVPIVPGALAVTVVSPTAGSTVPNNTKVITASFNKEMAPATLTPASFTLACNAAPITGGAVTYLAAGSTATLTLPAADLPGLAACTATITTVAKDLTGNSLAANYSWNFTTSAVGFTILPKVFSTVPLTSTPGPTGVLTTTPITATFDKVMDPATVTAAGAFTVAGVTAAATAVTYDIATKTATFHPLAALNPGTTYTATIKGTGASAVKDSTGNALAGNPTQPAVPNDYSWSFTTAVADPIPLGLASTFGTFGGSAGMTNTGTLTVVGGDIGTIATATSSITGFHDTGGDIYTETPANIGAVTGKIFTCTVSTIGPTSAAVNAASCTKATQARLDAQTAYLNLAGKPSTGALAANLAGTTILPGVYTNASSVKIEGGNLTLNGNGDPNAVFIFQIGSTLTVGGPGATSPQSVILTNGAKAKNVFWQVGTAATINAAGGGTMEGTIIANSGVTFSTVGNTTISTLNGRAMSLISSVTLVDTVINLPAP
jgi:hypothetical protein